jgi:hypothetical protein
VWAADSWDAVSRWVAAHIMAGTRFRRGAFPIHFLETTPPVFPRDPGYKLHIKDSSHLWWKIAEGDGGPAPKDGPTIWDEAVKR